MSPIPKKKCEFGRACARRMSIKVFPLKNHRGLKNKNKNLKFANIFLLLHRTITKEKIRNLIFFIKPQNGQIRSGPDQRKNKYFLSFS